MKKLLCLLLAMLLLSGCEARTAAPEPETTEPPSGAAAIEEKLASIHALGESPDDRYRTFYEIFVYSFRDSDGDGIGDLQGVISGLDYLQELGITGIWLMPIHPSPSYHKYDVLDYYSVDPAYGTMEDMEELLRETEKRGIRVIMDLVLNHTGSDHPWFSEACSYLKNLAPGEAPDPEVCPYVDYYNFRQEETCPGGFHPVPDAEGWFYEGRFSPQMPDVNFDSPALRQEQENVMAFWLSRGVDGFRLDAAKEFYTGQTEKNLEVLTWIRDRVWRQNPNAFLVAEVWDSFMTVAQYYESGFPSFFDFPFGASDGKIIKVLRGAGNASLVSSFAEAQEKAYGAYGKGNPNFMDAPFLSNHDVGRIAGFTGRTAEKTKLAGAMNLFMSGSAFIYYGEEIGMVAGAVDDPSYRAPMYWNGEGIEGVTQPPPGCTLPESYPFLSLREQMEDPDSIYHYYRQAIAIRNALPAIARGVPRAEAELNQNSVSACRKTWQDEKVIILMNISEEEKLLDLSHYADWDLAVGLSANGEEILRDGDGLTLPAWGSAILVPKGK